MILTAYSKLEDAIVEKLQPLQDAGIEVIPMPETDADFNESGTPFEKPRITVAYTSSEFDDKLTRGEPENYAVGIALQREFASLALNFQVRKLRGVGGLYSIYEDCRKLLLGYKPKNWDRIFFKTFNFVERGENTSVWYYALTVVCSRLVVQNESTDYNLINTDNTTLQAVSGEPILEELTLDVHTNDQ